MAIPGTRLRRRADLYLPAAVLLLSAFIGLYGHGAEPPAGPGFFAATSQIFPVLLVALFLEVASEMQRRRDKRDAMARELADLEDVLRPDDVAEIHRTIKKRKEEDRERFRFSLGVLYLDIIGGGASLVALGGHPTILLSALTTTCLLAGAVVLVGLFVIRVAADLDDEPRARTP